MLRLAAPEGAPLSITLTAGGGCNGVSSDLHGPAPTATGSEAARSEPAFAAGIPSAAAAAPAQAAEAEAACAPADAPLPSSGSLDHSASFGGTPVHAPPTATTPSLSIYDAHWDRADLAPDWRLKGERYRSITQHMKGSFPYHMAVPSRLVWNLSSVAAPAIQRS